MAKSVAVEKWYRELVEKYGGAKKYWPQWCATKKSGSDRWKIVLGAILVQKTSWYNANMALKNLIKVGEVDMARLAKIDKEKLINLIKPAGFYNAKSQRIIDLAKELVKINTKSSVEKIRSQLLEIKGVGPETADVILLYALDKLSFVVDEYAKISLENKGIKNVRKRKYEEIQKLFMSSLPKDLKVYQDFHALLIVDQKGTEKSRMEVV